MRILSVPVPQEPGATWHPEEEAMEFLANIRDYVAQEDPR
jgi:hypothetical protein